MRAGDLRHRVTIEESTGSLSPTGGVIAGTPTTITGIPMAIDPVPIQSMASERIAAGGLQGVTAYIVKCRYREDFTSSATLIEECCRQRRFEIHSLAPIGRNEGLEMLCMERTS
jgi:Phage head-tail joining protein